MNQEGTIRVFVVEDSPVIRTALTQRIQDDPRFIVVGFADTAQGAIGELDKSPPDMVIVDLHLKQGTGYDILAHLRRTGASEKFKAVVLTNYASAAHRRRALDLGASGFFDKSMQFDEMLDALRIWADERNNPGNLH